MTRILLAGACALAMAAPAHAQVIVNDPASIFQQVKSALQDLKAYGLQIQQYTTQAQQYAAELQQLNGFIHDPSLGAAMGLMGRVGLSNDLPINPYAVQSLTSGYGGLLSKVGSLGNLVNSSYSQSHVYSPSDGSWNSQQLIANGNSVAGMQGAAQAAYANLRDHMPVLQALRDRLATASTPKDVADAEAQIQAETAWTHSINTQLAAIDVNYRAEQDSRVQRDNEAISQSFDGFITRANGLGWP